MAVSALHWYRGQIERFAPRGTPQRTVYDGTVRIGRRVIDRPVPMAAATPRPSASPSVPWLPFAAEPQVSIVIPVHDQWALTSGCLHSIADDHTLVPFEVIVVDDASSDETEQELSKVAGVVVVRLSENQGFLGAVNAGIAAARGRFVLLLNNDTVCQPGWLDALVGTAEKDESIAIVGAKLVYPDGRLQEAGGVLWSDASGHNYGRDQNPDDPRFNFQRDVDYCSGACLLVRRELLDAVGGLDTRFAPAYYEDTDLCFAARAHGYRVVYQPKAVVFHLEGASNGTDTTTGIKHYQVVNQRTFQEKWAEALAAQGAPDPVHPRLTSWRTPAGRALVIDHQIPRPDHDSGSLRMFEILQLLGDLGLGVTFVPQDGAALDRYRGTLLDRGVEVLGGPGDLDAYLEDVGSALRIVILSRPTVAWANYPMIRSRAPGTTLIYDTVDLHYLREQGRADHEGGGSAKHNADFHYGMELSLARLTDQTWTVSPEERDVLLSELPHLDVEVVPNVHRDESVGPPYEDRSGILFVGSYDHPPNRDAAHWLVDEIFPLVRAEIPDIELHLVGSNPTADVEAMSGDGVVVHGWVPDLSELYRQVRLSVAPLRFGGGQKGKVGESLAFGVPVVTTPVGVQGFTLEQGYDAMIADSAVDLAKVLVDVYCDPDRWTALSLYGRKTVSLGYSPASVRQTLSKILTDLGVATKP